MAPSASFLLLVLSLASLATTTAHASFDLHAELNHPYTGSPLSKHEMLREAASASKARRARRAARVAKACGRGAISAADVLISPLGGSVHTMTVGIGTPPQPHTLIFDTGSDLIWTQCKLFRHAAKQREPLYDPSISSSFSATPCNGKLCQASNFGSKNCRNNRCLYTYGYGSATTEGELASETFTFGAHHKVPVSLSFGCGRLSSGSLDGASGLLGISPHNLSLVSQLQIPRFSYCLTPFTSRKTSHIFFGEMANLSKYRTTGPIQTTSLIDNRVIDNEFYYVPLASISVGTKFLSVPASSFAIRPDGSGGTYVDSGNTVGALPAIAYKALLEALVEAIKLPLRNSSDPNYQFCFQLPHGMPMKAVHTPTLVYHFNDGAKMVLTRDNYFVELNPGEMCLVLDKMEDGAVIGNFQQQNMHVLYDLRNHKFSFAPTQCDQI